MKRVLSLLLIIIAWGNTSNAQALFKDLEPGNNVSSTPYQFTNVNGTVYFLTDPSLSRRHALWKTDGTVANTVMVKDSLISTSVTDRVMIRGHINDTLYYTINQNVQVDTTTELWMVKNGSAPVMVTTLTSRMVNSFSNGEPRLYTIAGSKLYFQMYTDHGYELWVSDGTAAGTFEVVDLFPGSTSGIANGGANPVPMIGYNGKVYFQGITSFSGTEGLYCSDGTPTGTVLVKDGANFNPRSFYVYNNELFFQAKSGTEGLWKTDGTTPGTSNINNIGFNGDVRVFKNEMFYSVGSTMYKSNGTPGGTAAFKDSVGIIIGMNNDYFLTRYMRTMPVAPYFEYYYWRSDGTATGTVRVADSLVNASSFVVQNNKMYGAVLGDALWQTDGTDTGTHKLLTGIINYPFILNNTLFFTNFGTGTGYELWSLELGPPTSGIAQSQIDNSAISVYPNPSNGHIRLAISDLQPANASLEIYNTMGKKVYSKTLNKQQNVIDISSLSNGVYFIKVYNGPKVYTQKIILQQ